MSEKTIQKEAKTPDKFLAALRQVLEIALKNKTQVLIVVVLAIVGGGAFAIYSYVKDKQERAAQAEYYLIEKDYLKIKEDFEKSKSENMPKTQAKEEPKEVQPVAPTGDLEKDYGPIVQKLESFIKTHPGKKASLMSGLTLADIYNQYNKPAEAANTLKSLEPNLNKDLLSALVYNQYGNILANQKDCTQALEKWKKVTDLEKAKFLHHDAYIRMGLCYESMSDFAQAEQYYQKAAIGNSNSQTSKAAEKYLRLLKIKKSATTGS